MKSVYILEEEGKQNLVHNYTLLGLLPLALLYYIMTSMKFMILI